MAGAAAFCLLIFGQAAVRAETPQEKLAAVRAAYRALKSFSCELRVTTSADAAGMPPFQAKVALKFPTQAAISVTDGATAFRVVGGPAGRQTIPVTGQIPAEKEAKPAMLADSLAAAHLESTFLAALLTDAPLPGAEKVSEVSLGGAPPVLAWSHETDSGTEEITLSIGKDALLQSATVTIGKGPTAFRRTETYTSVQANPDLPEMVFAFEDASLRPKPTKGAAAQPLIPQEQRSQSFDNGVINPLDAPEVIHDFPLKNLSDKPLVVRRLLSSCGCMTSIVAPSAPAVAPASPSNVSDLPENALPETALARIPPGGETTIRVRVRTTGLPAGTLTKSVGVVADGSKTPIARLEMRGNLLPVVGMPPTVDFGKRAAGESAVREIAVPVNVRLGDINTPAPTLVASNPMLKTAYLGKDGPDPKAASAYITYRYQVTLPASAPLGPLRETLTLQPAKTSGEDSEYKDFWDRAVSSVVGQIDGDISADPPLLALGSVPVGETAVRKVQLTYKGEKPVVGRKITAKDPNLTAVPGAVIGASEALTVTVRADAPGPLKTSVQVLLPNGQRLVIPVTGFAFATAAHTASGKTAPEKKP